MNEHTFEIRVCPAIRPGELYEFYRRNNICEAGHGRELAEVVLHHPGVWMAAYGDGRLISFARALCDGLHSLDPQGGIDIKEAKRIEYWTHCRTVSNPFVHQQRVGSTLR